MSPRNIKDLLKMRVLNYSKLLSLFSMQLRVSEIEKAQQDKQMSSFRV